jgi:putative PEP-CTERM system TPR-repeat lipoprotein
MSRHREKRKTRWWLWALAVVALGGVATAGYVATAKLSGTSDYFEDAQGLMKKGKIREAIIQLKNAVKTDPNNLEARYGLAIAYLQVNDAISAEKELRTALNRGYDESKIAAPLARAYLMQLKYDNVLKEAQPGERGKDVEHDLRIYRGYALFGLKRYDEAEASFNDARQLKPTDPRGLVGLGRLLEELGRFKEAEQRADEALALTSVPQQMAETLTLKGNLRRLQRDSEGALLNFTKAIQADAGANPARIGRAVLLIDRKEDAAAAEDVAALLKALPGQPVAVYLDALLKVRRNDIKPAIETLQNMVNKVANPYPPALYLLGNLLLGTNETEQAETNLTRYVAMVEGDVTARKILAGLLIRKNASEKAIIILNRAAELAPKDPEVAGLMASAFMRKRDFAEASKWFDRAAEVAPESARTQQQIAMGRLRLNQPERAIKDLERAIDLDPGSVQARTMLTLTNLRAGKYAEAIAAAEALKKQTPDSPIPDNLMGAIAVAKQDLPTARQSYEAALKLQANFVPAMLNLARLDLSEGKLDEAKTRYEKVTTIDPKNLDAFTALADMALRANRRDEAMQWYEKAATANPNRLLPRLRIIDLMLAGQDHIRAQALARELLQRSPNQPDLLDALGRAQLAANDHKQAIATYRQLSQTMPNSAPARQRLARAYSIGGDEQAAIETLREALNIDANFLPATADLIEVEIKAGRGDAAMRMASEWRLRNPGAPAGDTLVGEVAARLERFKDAAEAFNAAFQKERNSGNLGRLANAQYRAGDRAGAFKSLEEWVKVTPDDLAARQMLAAAYLTEDRKAEAIKAYEALIERNPNNTMALNNLAWLYGEVNDKRAVATAERAAALAPKSDAVADTLGSVLVKFGQVERGLKLLADAERKQPNHAEIKWHLVQALKASGRNDEARYKLLELLKIAPSDFKDIEAARRMLQELGG